MDSRNQIIEEYQKFKAFLDTIDLEKLKNDYSREELKALKDTLKDINLQNIPYQLMEIIDKKKEEEYPELLGVHHYPIINEIDFLTEKEKLKLDEFLVRHRVGSYVRALWRVLDKRENQKQLEDWLIEHGVLSVYYALNCPHCGEDLITKLMNEDEFSKLKETFTAYEKDKSHKNYEAILNLSHMVEGYCMECEDCCEIEDLKFDKFHIAKYPKLTMDRDKSLDNV